MRPYESLIEEALHGKTPKEKYEYLIMMKKLLQQIGWPRRGTEEEMWTLYQVGNRAQDLIGQYEEVDG